MDDGIDVLTFNSAEYVQYIQKMSQFLSLWLLALLSDVIPMSHQLCVDPIRVPRDIHSTVVM